MKAILIVLSSLTLLFGCSTQSDNSSDSGAILSEIWSFLTDGTIEHFFGCKSHDNFTQDDIRYLLYTRNNQNYTELTLNNLSPLDKTKPTKIIFTGWTGTYDDTRILSLVEAYLTRYDCNVIFVDAIKLTNAHYAKSYCNSVTGAEMIGDFLCEMHKQDYLDFDQVHMVGLSIGAQMMGLAGQRIQQQCNQKADRFTGLDPAGPIYQGQDISKRLDKSDANFVDVIHSNMGILGYYGSVGHVDFFPNCGSAQPGCIKLKNASNPIVVISDFFSCSHGRSLQLFIKTVGGAIFNATSCTSCPDSNGIGKCLGEDSIKPQYAIMGEDCPRNSLATKYFVKANGNFSYAQE